MLIKAFSKEMVSVNVAGVVSSDHVMNGDHLEALAL